MLIRPCNLGPTNRPKNWRWFSGAETRSYTLNFVKSLKSFGQGGYIYIYCIYLHIYIYTCGTDIFLAMGQNYVRESNDQNWSQLVLETYNNYCES